MTTTEKQPPITKQLHCNNMKPIGLHLTHIIKNKATTEERCGNNTGSQNQNFCNNIEHHCVHIATTWKQQYSNNMTTQQQYGNGYGIMRDINNITDNF